MRIYLITLVVVFFASALVCAFAGIYERFELQREINQKLPVGQSLEPLFWGPIQRQRFRELQRQVLPDSPRPKRILRLQIGFYCFAAATLGAAWLAGLFH